VKCHGGTGSQNMMVPLGESGSIVSARIKNSSLAVLAVVTGPNAATITECCRTLTSELGNVIRCHRILTEQEYEETFCLATREQALRPFICGTVVGITAHMMCSWVLGFNNLAWIIASGLLTAYATTR